MPNNVSADGSCGDQGKMKALIAFAVANNF